MKYIANSSSIKNLKYLDVRSTKITDTGICEYLHSKNSTDLKYLDISYLGDGITTATIQALCESEYCKGLVVLRCRNSLIGDNAI